MWRIPVNWAHTITVDQSDPTPTSSDVARGISKWNFATDRSRINMVLQRRTNGTVIELTFSQRTAGHVPITN